MKTSKTFSIHFWLKKSSRRKNGKTPIYARITVDGNRADISLKRTIANNQWCTEAGRINSRVNGAKKLNDYLDETYSDFLTCHKQLKGEHKFITAQTIKARYLGEDESEKTLKDLLKYHRDEETLKLEKGTSKNYSSTEKYLLSYILKRYKTSNIYLAQINYAFVSNFEHYLRTAPPLLKSKPLHNNGIMKHMERFHKMTNIGLKLDWMDKDPFAQHQLSFVEYERTFLTMKELLRMEKMAFSKRHLTRVRDIFVFACYTGLSYIDVKNLRKEHLVLGMDGEEWIYTRRQKSKKPVKVPLLAKASTVLNGYKKIQFENKSDFLLPVFSNQKMNEYLKEISNKCNIGKNITFHVARHTFATTITLSNGMPMETVSKLLGHTKLVTTQIYAKVLEKKVSEDMNALRRKLE